MKSTILLLAVATAAFSSCTTAYKTGQTPDDVYFSPAPPQQDEYVRVEKKDERKYRNTEEYYDDRYLRMKVQNRTQWSDLDDWYYYDNRYNYSSYNNWNNPWSPNAYWNYYYNPYCNSCCIVGNGKNNIVYGTPRIFNMNTYNSMALTNSNYNNSKLGGGSVNIFGGLRNPSQSSGSHNNNGGNFLRNIFNNNNSSSNNTSGAKPSSSSGSSSSSSSGSSSSGSSAPVRRF